MTFQSLNGFSSAFVHFLKKSTHSSHYFIFQFSGIQRGDDIRAIPEFNFAILILLGVFFKVTELNVEGKDKCQQQPTVNLEKVIG